MKIKRINGLDFERMIKNGLSNLKMNEEKVNSMNVFPVIDGDTGTNMCLTIENGIKHAKSCENLGEYLKDLSQGMLLGARGNSGVILSQIFRGFYLELARDSIADVGELRDAFIRGYKTAYQMVSRPVEGTILTVAREGIENIKKQIGRDVYVPNLFSMYLAEMKKTLAQTPEMLAVLKEAGVVDSGGMGYVLLVEGMEKSLFGEEIKFENVDFSTSKTPDIQGSSAFNSSSTFELGYCMEFLLQLLNSRKEFDLASYTKDLQLFGDSLVCVQSEEIVKVHIHTKTPDKIIYESQKFGEFINFKLENMQIQHEEMMASSKKKEKLPHKALSVIAISNGQGVKELFESFGCDIVIDGGKTMNTSAEELLQALNTVSADKIVLFPNNENIIKAAEQAISMSGLDNVVLIPSKSVMECYYALAMDISDDEVEERVQSMEESISSIRTFSITRCAKNCVYGGVECTLNEFVVVEKGKPIACVGEINKVFELLIEKNVFEDAENCIIFTGEGVNGFDASRAEELLTQNNAFLEVAIVDGQQRVYDLIVGVV